MFQNNHIFHFDYISIMATFTSQIAILFLQLVFATTFCLTISSHHKLPLCNEKDQHTLFIFKKGIIDHSGQLSTWSAETDCCAWEGVQCNNITGRVTELHLSGGQVLVEEGIKYRLLKGEINFIFLELEFLNYLDLSYNNFTVTSIVHNLSHASHLHYLDLSYNKYLHMDNLHWLSQLSSLKYLNLTYTDLHKETNWLQEVAMLPSLSDLRLSQCNLGNIMVSPFLNYVNFTSLVTLHLWGNNFNSELPKGLFNFTGEISYLDLSMSNINGEIPSNLLSLRKLSYLDLSSNQLIGSIPDSIGQLEHLQYLRISSNMFSGSVPSTLGNLSSLVHLYIGSNNFWGEIKETTFSKLSNLNVLDMRNSTFAFQLGPEWVPPFQLRGLDLGNTNQGPNFPLWIYTQNSLEFLDLSSTGISLAGGNKFWRFVEGPYGLFLSNNSMSGDISHLTLNASLIELDHNNFTGRLPCLSPMTTFVDFSYNSFSGSIPHSWEKMVDLLFIDLWNNRLSGELLDLSNLKDLRILILGENELSGTIPGNLPQRLTMIILRANNFEGIIPPQLFNLSSLFHIDLAHNKLSGFIPQCAYNMTQMVTSNIYYNIFAKFDLSTKGQHYYLDRTNPERQIIDFSSNNLSGEIPSELFQLIQVQTLNLSHNNLIGVIPNMIGEMKRLESLDLSNNELSGEIPQSMAVLTFLNYLNLSCNNFVGQIPIGTQLQSFGASSYTGNPELCGEPLQKCLKEEENPENNAKPSSTWNQDDDPFRESLYQGMGVGFATGFLGIWGSLFLIRKWRHTCFRFFDRVNDKIYVALMVKLNKIRKTQSPPVS